MAHNRQELVLPDVGDVTSLIVRGVSSFARKNKIITGSYLFGIAVLLFAGSGAKLTLDQRRKYDHIMSTINVEAEYKASSQYWQADQIYRSSRGWFTCDSLCQRNKRRMELARARLEEIRAEGNARMSDAKSVAGLFSEVGVGEVKDSFWQYFSKGKQFAKRQSMWDFMFMGIRSMGRDESTAEFILRMLLQLLINFSLGLIAALGVFVFGLWSLVRSYQPNPVTAVAFFLCAATAAFSFVTTYLLVLYGAAAGGLYGVAKMATTQARLQQQQQQERQRMYNRPHYD